MATSAIPDLPHELDSFLRIQSISSDLDYSHEMSSACRWVVDFIRDIGGGATIEESGNQPMVVGFLPASSPTAVNVLLYGHYDVQPPGDRDLWESDPFIPSVRDGCVYARGASDDKGNFFILLSAAAELVRENRLPVNLHILCEGEEEIGGSSASKWVARSDTRFAACIIFDGLRIQYDTPTLCTATRGLIYAHIVVSTGNRELHSGTYGGAAINAAHVLLDSLGRVADVGGRIPQQLADGPLDPTDEELAAWSDVVPEGLDKIPLLPGVTPQGFMRKTWTTPSIDIHGLKSGEARLVKTSIPDTAEATISMRLAPGQDVEECQRRLCQLLTEDVPSGATAEVNVLTASAPGRTDHDSHALKIATTAYERVLGKPPLITREGGTLPILGALAARNIPTIMTTFSEPDDNVHAPNERFGLRRLTDGIAVAKEILAGLAAT